MRMLGLGIALVWSASAHAVGHVEIIEQQPVDPCAPDPDAHPDPTYATDSVSCAFRKAFDYEAAPSPPPAAKSKREQRREARERRREERRNSE